MLNLIIYYSYCSAFFTIYNDELFTANKNIEFLITGDINSIKNNKLIKIYGDYQYCYITRKYDILCGINAKA